MTTNKDLKRVIRARMKKTGEAYTAARAQVVRRKPPARPPNPESAEKIPALPQTEYAAIAGMSDAVVKEKTGCTWAAWVKSLDYYGASTMSHREIAELVRSKYKVRDWWTQAVTVGYERIKGLRARGQRRDGSYEASKSRTYNVPVKKLFDAWSVASKRRKWLDQPGIRVRTSTPPKSIRLGWSDGGIVALYFTPKGEDRSSVSVQHTGLLDRESAEALKVYWSERLDALAATLA